MAGPNDTSNKYNDTFVVQDKYYDFNVVIPMSIILCVIMILSIGGNSMVVLTIFRHRGMRTRTNMFITNLAISDILAAVFDMPISLVSLIKGGWIFDDAFCQFNGFTMALFLITSVHTLMYISVHKYISITRPFSRFMTPKRILYMIVCTWLWAGLYALSALLGWNRSEFKPGATQCGPSLPDNKLKMSHSLINTLFNFLIPLAVMSFCYFNIFREIRNHMNRMRETSNMDMRNSLSQQKRISVTLFMVLACYLTCLSPYVVYSCIAAFTRDKKKIPTVLNPVSYWCVYASSAINPIIYAFRSPSFRQGYKEIVCGKSSSYLSGESAHPDALHRLSGRQRRGLRRYSDTSWRSASFFSSWRGYMNTRSSKNGSVSSSCRSSAEKQGQNKSRVSRKCSNGNGQGIMTPVEQVFQVIPEVSGEDEAVSIGEVECFKPALCSINKDKADRVLLETGKHDPIQVTINEEEEDNTTNAEIQVNEQTQDMPQCKMNGDVFTQNQVQLNTESSQTSLNQRRINRLGSRSCIFTKHDDELVVKCSPDNDCREAPPLTRARSLSDLSKSTEQDKTQKSIAKKPLPAPFLWQPSVDYLDVPRHLLRSKQNGHSDGNLVESGKEKNQQNMTKQLTSSFRVLFGKSKEKNLDSENTA